MLMPVVTEVFANIGVTKSDMGFVCSGSTDYLVGAPFSFVMALDAVGVWPPMRESHVEMDGAWALYEAWTLLQEGEIDTALVYSFGRSSPSQLDRILALQLDPYYMAPMWPDPVALAALQAQALIDAGKATEKDFAAVAARSRRDALGNPNAQVAKDQSAEELLRDDYVVAPLRRHALPPITDGVAAVVLAAGDRARGAVRAAGVDHRHRPPHRGPRPGRPRPVGVPLDPRRGARAPGVFDASGDAPGAVDVDVAELHAPFAPPGADPARGAAAWRTPWRSTPRAGRWPPTRLMVAGLLRIGEAAARIMDGSARSAIAHATSGPCLQQNLVCALAAEPAGPAGKGA